MLPARLADPPAHSGPAGPITDVLVGIPVRDEAARISACLSSIERAVDALTASHASAARDDIRAAPRVMTVVVLDSCGDETSRIVARFPWVEAVHADVGGVGAARSLAIDRGLSLMSAQPGQSWIANTDADSRVPLDWLTHQIELADLGADVVCGLVDPDEIECGPARYAAWLAAYLRIDGHHHVHGANLGIRAECYLDCGGFAATRKTREDVALVRGAEARGWTVLGSRGATVRTSGRTEGRVHAGGFAGYLRSCVPSSEPEPLPALLEASA